MRVPGASFNTRILSPNLRRHDRPLGAPFHALPVSSSFLSSVVHASCSCSCSGRIRQHATGKLPDWLGFFGTRLFRHRHRHRHGNRHTPLVSLVWDSARPGVLPAPRGRGLGVLIRVHRCPCVRRARPLQHRGYESHCFCCRPDHVLHLACRKAHIEPDSLHRLKALWLFSLKIHFIHVFYNMSDSVQLMPGQSAPFAIVTPTDQRGVLWIVTAFCLATAITSLLIRAYVRVEFSQSYGKDDISISGAFVSALSHS